MYSSQEAINKYVLGLSDSDLHKYTEQGGLNVYLEKAENAQSKQKALAEIIGETGNLTVQQMLNKELGETNLNKYTEQEAWNILQGFLPNTNLAFDSKKTTPTILYPTLVDGVETGTYSETVDDTGYNVYILFQDTDDITFSGLTDGDTFQFFDSEIGEQTITVSGTSVTIGYEGSGINFGNVRVNGVHKSLDEISFTSENDEVVLQYLFDLGEGLDVYDNEIVDYVGTGAIPSYCLIEFPDDLTLDIFDRTDTNFFDASNVEFYYYDVTYPRRFHARYFMKGNEFVKSLMLKWNIFTQLRTSDNCIMRIVGYGEEIQTDLVDGWDFTNWTSSAGITEKTTNTFTGTNNGWLKKGFDFVVGETYNLKITGSSDAVTGIRVIAYNTGSTSLIEVWNTYAKGAISIDKSIIVPTNCNGIGFYITSSASCLTTITNFEVIKTEYDSISEANRTKALKALKDSDSDASDYLFYCNPKSALLDSSDEQAFEGDSVAKVHSISEVAIGDATNITYSEDEDGKNLLFASGGELALNVDASQAYMLINADTTLFEVEGNKLTYSEMVDFGYKLRNLIVDNFDVLSSKIVVRYNAGIVRVVSKFDADRDIIIEFKKSLYNDLVTFNGVYLRANTNVRPDKYEGSVLTGVTKLNDASSDNVGPYNCTPAGATFSEWVGGSHQSADDSDENTTWQEITAVTENTIELDDATDYPTPDGTVTKMYLILKEWNGTSYVSYGRYFYTGKTSDTLTGVAEHYSGSDITLIEGIGTANPPFAVLVYQTASTTATEFKLDGTTLTDDGIWYKGDELVAVINNKLYDPNSIRSNPLTPASWTELILEEITYKLKAGGCVGINYSSITQPIISKIDTYYGLQSVSPASWAEKIYLAESADDELKTYSAGQESGSIDDYPNADKVISYDATDNILQELKIDLESGLPSQSDDFISNTATVNRIENPSKIYFYQIANKENILAETVFAWSGVHNYTTNLTSVANMLVYKRRFKDEDYIVVDFTGSMTFPSTQTINITELQNKTVTIDYATSGITASSLVLGSTGITLTALNAGQMVIKMS